MAHARTGAWLIGAKGGVAATATVGWVALKKGLIGQAGLVTELPLLASLELADWKDFVFGGHEIREVSLYDEARRMHTESRAIDAEILAKCKTELEKIEQNHRPGTIQNVGGTIAELAGQKVRKFRESPRQTIERVQEDLREFAATHKLDHVIAVNVSSTEPPFDVTTLPGTWSALEALLEKPDKHPLPASSLYAVAALDLGYSYINFTPSLGSTPPAICELALLRKTRHMGYDGKTGETLLKSVLAPMFARRNLNVMSWVGHNIFGNMDGKVLDNPENKKTKVTSKDRLLHQIFGYSPQTLVSIEYIESLGDWKTAWDHIHFKGFLGTPMTMQFIWQGCDSLLAAPLVLDLIRLTQRSWRAGQTGVMTQLASFFKSPLGVDDHDFTRQYQMLETWAGDIAAK